MVSTPKGRSGARPHEYTPEHTESTREPDTSATRHFGIRTLWDTSAPQKWCRSLSLITGWAVSHRNCPGSKCPGFSSITALVSKCLETGAEVSQSVLMPKCLVAEVSGNHPQHYPLVDSFYLLVKYIQNWRTHCGFVASLKNACNVYLSPIFLKSLSYNGRLSLPYPRLKKAANVFKLRSPLSAIALYVVLIGYRVSETLWKAAKVSRVSIIVKTNITKWCLREWPQQ